MCTLINTHTHTHWDDQFDKYTHLENKKEVGGKHKVPRA